jgi:hypothetical protein
MKSVVSMVGVLAISAAFVCAVSGQSALADSAPNAKSFEGVWKVTKVVKTGPNAGTNTHLQASLAIYSGGYFSIVRDDSLEPRKPAPAAKDPKKLTDAEKVAFYDEWAPFIASGGTYEVRGHTIIMHNILAKRAAGATATEEAVIVQFTGDTYVVRPQPNPLTPPGEVVERTYTRIR